jgi:hypothetical protein
MPYDEATWPWDVDAWDEDAWDPDSWGMSHVAVVTTDDGPLGNVFASPFARREPSSGQILLSSFVRF